MIIVNHLDDSRSQRILWLLEELWWPIASFSCIAEFWSLSSLG